MLIGFSFKNFASFYDDNIITMIASADTKFHELNTYKTKYGRLLKSVFLFGANGSGKSNFINAINYMKTLVLAEFRTQSKMMCNINNFLFSEIANKTPSLFEVEFIANDIVYTYGFEILNGEINQEYLHRKTKRKTPVFIRTSPDFKDISLSKDMDNVKDLTQNTRRDTLFLYWANGGNNEIAMTVYRWFENIQIFSTTEAKHPPSSTAEYLEKDENCKNNVLALLQKTDINILDLEFEKETKNQDNNKRISLLSVNTKHQLYDENWKKTGTISTPITFESAGTIKLLKLSAPIIEALEKGNVVFIDEIDSQLHSMLVKYFVMMFNSISDNPKNSQLICNTHDVLLLDEDIRRDQIYFAEKDEFGKSKLYSLTDFQGVRKESKLLKQYLLGSFGAIPKLQNYFPLKPKVRP